jgi:hypothetical protein
MTCAEPATADRNVERVWRKMLFILCMPIFPPNIGVRGVASLLAPRPHTLVTKI